VNSEKNANSSVFQPLRSSHLKMLKNLKPSGRASRDRRDFTSVIVGSNSLVSTVSAAASHPWPQKAETWDDSNLPTIHATGHKRFVGELCRNPYFVHLINALCPTLRDCADVELAGLKASLLSVSNMVRPTLYCALRGGHVDVGHLGVGVAQAPGSL